ncbi:hypothetical protein PMAYCL1PPCAC_29619, partial [Pristionchus mayeri]
NSFSGSNTPESSTGPHGSFPSSNPLGSSGHGSHNSFSGSETSGSKFPHSYPSTDTWKEMDPSIRSHLLPPLS